MCNYCDVTKNTFERMINLEPKLKQATDCVELSIIQYNSKTYLAEFVGEDDLDISNVYATQIKFCPMCGRELDE